MPSGPVKIAVLGGGYGAKIPLPVLGDLEEFEPVAVWSRRSERARELAEKHDLTLGTSDVDELLAHPGLDALSVCTPHRRHPEDTITAARAGKHVLIEKPVATTPEELHAMDAAVREAGVRTVVSFVLRWIPLVQAAKAMLAEGLFGEPIYVQADYWHNPEQSGYPGATDHLRRMDASAMLLGGCHAVDLARHLMGSDVVEVSAQQTAGEPDLPFPPMQAALLKFANGRIGKVSACVEQWMPYQFNVDLLGTAGGLRDNRFYSRKLPGVTDWATFPTVLPNSGAVSHHPFQGEIDHFLDCVRRGVESHASLRDAVNTHEACFAVDRSGAAGGAPVRLPLAAP